MRECTEDNIREALDAMENFLSSRKASLLDGIPRSTLLHRVQGTQPRTLAFEPLQKLSAIRKAVDRLDLCPRRLRPTSYACPGPGNCCQPPWDPRRALSSRKKLVARLLTPKSINKCVEEQVYRCEEG
jgi:hypothetical protein